MLIVIQGMFRWLTRHAILLVVVIAMLAAAPYIREEFRQFKAIIGELAILGNGKHGIVDLPDGAAFVCQPRSLAGVIQDRGNPVRITRHWRLGMSTKRCQT